MQRNSTAFNSAVYKRKRTGPRQEPWGTPTDLGRDDENNCPLTFEFTRTGKIKTIESKFHQLIMS